jgi:hypothetical protein
VRVKRFSVRVAANNRGHAVIAIPIDSDEEWRHKALHHVNGTVNGCRVRVTIEPGHGGWAFTPIFAVQPRGEQGRAAGRHRRGHDLVYAGNFIRAGEGAVRGSRLPGELVSPQRICLVRHDDRLCFCDWPTSV